jgi:hypothetical protein
MKLMLTYKQQESDKQQVYRITHIKITLSLPSNPGLLKSGEGIYIIV